MNPNRRMAMAKAFARTGGEGQFCGHLDATDRQHWARVYPLDAESTAND